MTRDSKSISSRSVFSSSDAVSAGTSVGNGTAFEIGTVFENSSNDGTMSMEPPDEESQKVGKREDIFIDRVRILVAFVLVVAVTAVAVVAYLLVTEQEQDEFENEFNGHASEVAAVVGQNIEKLFEALDSTSIMISSEASAQNETWPYVTVDHWSLKAERLVKLGDIGQSMLALAPIVQQDMVNNWTTYVNQQAPKRYQSSINPEDSDKSIEDLIIHTVPYVHTYTVDSFVAEPVEREGPVAPIWQSYPLRMGEINPSIQELPTNYDIFRGLDGATNFVEAVNATLRPTITLTSVSVDEKTREKIAMSEIVQPIFEDVDAPIEDAKLVGVLWWQIDWNTVFSRLLDRDVTGIVVVLRSSCQASNGQEQRSQVTYRINGPNAILLARKDVHNREFDGMEISQVVVDLSNGEVTLPLQHCTPKVTLHLYPTKDFRDKFVTEQALYYAGVIVLIFCFTTVVFLLYDYLVGQRQRIVMDRIMRQDKIVSDVFPSAIRNRLYNQHLEVQDNQKDDLLDPLDFGPSNMIGSAPLADLFPNTTVIFADIVGFTAWSSAREPSQVFVLLETIYSAFDKIAYRQNVFKVETVGDCYVAVAGLPDPNEEHAVSACRFARSCLKKMKEITLKLEVSLGPDTADLDLRIGIHSGQVTAGVLRGERSRFQLFGDTMNTAARMEHTGERNRIQLTEATANLLKEAGLERWILPRSTTIFVKGKGNMQTYWVKTIRGRKKSRSKKEIKKTTKVEDTIKTVETSEETSDTRSEQLLPLDHSDTEDQDDDDLDYEAEPVEEMTKTDRLVEWNVENLSTLLQQIIASRGGVVQPIDGLRQAEASVGKNGTVLEEFIPIIHLKKFGEDELRNRLRPTEVDIGEAARAQLRMLLSNIALLYQDNPFHNYEHASHVTASVQKLLSRIVKVGASNGLDASTNAENLDLVDLAGHSYGITSDPLTQFAVVFSAIIHDSDHPGVPNSQLVKEKTRSAHIYKNKSVAEQNSVDLAWEILMRDEYKDLRACIYQTEDDLRRFRQLVVNTVMATDIVDKELQALRKKRWEEAFSGTFLNEPESISVDRKATIVIEHLIQASDVSHTMQHWHIYKTWNEKFFMECYGAYKAGRGDTDPSINWYKGEIGFFDFYVIPLAKKLDDCGVFGVSSEEYLNYAKANREEWAREGEKIVQDFLAKYEEKMSKKGNEGTVQKD